MTVVVLFLGKRYDYDFTAAGIPACGEFPLQALIADRSGLAF
jgi:hypothetical protein